MSKNEIDSIAFLILAWFAGLVILGIASDVIKDQFFSEYNQSRIKDKIYNFLEFSTKFCFSLVAIMIVSIVAWGMVIATMNAVRVL